MRRVRRPQAGLTLLELVIAIIILAIGSLAAIRASDQARLAIGGEMPRLLASIAAHNRVEEVRLLGAASGSLPGQVQIAGQDISLTVTRKATSGGLQKVTVTAQIPGGPGAVLGTYIADEVPR